MKKTRVPRTGDSTSYPRPGSLARALGALTVGAGAMVGMPQAQADSHCLGEAEAFEAAVTAGTKKAMDAFVEEYPSCALTDRVFALINDLDPAAGTPESDDDPERGAGPDDPGSPDSDPDSDSGSDYEG